MFTVMNNLKRIKLGGEWVMRDMARRSRLDLGLGSNITVNTNLFIYS